MTETKDVLPLVKQLAGCGLWAKEKEVLYRRLDGDDEESLHASLALLPEDDKLVKYLCDRLLKASPTELPVIRDALKQYQEGLVERLVKASPTELPVIRDALKQYQEGLVERLWSVLEQPEDQAQCLQAASALALYDPANSRWKNVGGKVAHAMVKVNPATSAPGSTPCVPLRVS